MNFKWRTRLAAALLPAILAACGGASNQVVQNFGAVDVSLNGGSSPAVAGTTVMIVGKAVTLSTRLSTVSWSVASPAGAPVATTTNTDCATANEVTTVSHAASGASPATGSSIWSCALSITAPTTLTSTATYVATFKATDELGTTQSGTQSVVFSPAASQSQQIVANAGGSFTAAPSSTSPIHCSVSGGTAPYTYSWTVPSNGGQAVSLSSYTGADTTLTAPAVAAQLALQCKVTDANGSSGSAVVNVTVQKSTTAAVLTASAGPTFSVTSGATAPLQCTAAGNTGAVSYSWSIVSNGGLPISLVNLSSQVASFVAPTVTTPTTITAQCVASDSTTATASADVAVTVMPSASNATLTSFAGTDFSVVGGASTPLHCDATGGTGPYSFQWVISSNGGLATSLSQYTGADTILSSPVTSSDTPVTVQCRATDNKQAIATSLVNVDVTSSSKTNTTLVANVNASAVVSPGQVVTLSTTNTGWYGNDGTLTTGPVISYSWTSSDPGVAFSNVTSASPTFIVPVGITSATQIPVTLTATGGGQSASATTVYTVDPNGVMSLTVSPAASEGKASAGVSYSFTATATYSGATRALYYQWTQVSGPSVPLGGDTTTTLGIAPTAVGTYVFRIAVGNEPITALNPGLYFTDVVLTLQ